MSEKGERDVVDKESAALVRSLDGVKQRIRQSEHDPVTRIQRGCRQDPGSRIP